MQSLVPNPVYDLLMRGSTGLSFRATNWIRAGILVAGLAVSLLPDWIPNLWELDSGPALTVSGLAVLVAVLSPLAGLALTSGIMSRAMTAENFSLLRLTSLPSAKIESGCLAGVSDRLGLLRTIGLWALPGGLVGCACVAGGIFADPGCFGPPPLSMAYASQGAPLALGAIAVGMMAFRTVWRWCIRVGVWLALWLGERAQAAGAMAAVISLGLTGLFLLASTRLGEYQTLMIRVLIVLAALAIPAALIGIQSRIAHNESLCIIEGLDGSEPDNLMIE